MKRGTNVGEIDFNRLTHCMSLLSSDKETEIVATDLYDILESAPKIQDLILQIVSTNITKEKMIDLLIELETELDHFNWHYENFKKELKNIEELD